MKKHLKVEKGDSIDNAIVIDATNSILGVIQEHKHISRIFLSISTITDLCISYNID